MEDWQPVDGFEPGTYPFVFAHPNTEPHVGIRFGTFVANFLTPLITNEWPPGDVLGIRQQLIRSDINIAMFNKRIIIRMNGAAASAMIVTWPRPRALFIRRDIWRWWRRRRRERATLVPYRRRSFAMIIIRRRSEDALPVVAMTTVSDGGTGDRLGTGSG